MKALIDYIPPDENEGDSLGEWQFDEINVDWSQVAPEEVKRIQRQFRELRLPNGESLEVKAQSEKGGFAFVVHEEGEFLAQFSSNGSSSFAFRTLHGATVLMSIQDSAPAEHA